MKLFSNENRVKCGKCNTEFDLNQNKSGCPLCGFGGKTVNKEIEMHIIPIENKINETYQINLNQTYLSIPLIQEFPKGKIPEPDGEFNKVGHWGMFNDFFSGKALLRINANLIQEQGTEYISLFDLIETAKVIIQTRGLSDVKGFPNKIDSDSAIGRLVRHFVDGFWKMGLFDVKRSDNNSEKDDIWNEDWEKILIRPTKEGLDFARLKNTIFDEKRNDYSEQVLTPEESEWMISYLKKINSDGFKEYDLLHEVYSFIKKGNNGKEDLWNWFKTNPKFISYVQHWSEKAHDPKAFKAQLASLAQTFSASKISLLRELRLIKNKRNDYTVIGDFK